MTDEQLAALKRQANYLKMHDDGEPWTADTMLQVIARLEAAEDYIKTPCAWRYAAWRSLKTAAGKEGA